MIQRVSKWLFYLLVFPVTLGICGWQGWAWWSWASAPVLAETDAAGTSKSIKIEIPEGTSGQQIGQDLESIGTIRSKTAWNLWARWQSIQKREGGFQAGTYELSPTQSLVDIANQIWQGQVVQQSFTIPEGWSLQQMAEYFETQGFFSAEEFLKAAQQPPYDRHPWLPANLPHLEGFLYPDTYQVTAQVSPTTVVDQMLSRFQQVALPIYQQGQSDFTLLDWVTLSSIVEKEAVVSSERDQIASVFAKRLREGMTLGADPTVEYGLGIRQTRENPLTYAQVNTPSPYNTYINPGLPPTPIASPGRASLAASLDPADTEYLYFVARYDGTHVFSRTLAEHEAAQIAIRDEIAAETNADSETAN